MVFKALMFGCFGNGLQEAAADADVADAPQLVEPSQLSTTTSRPALHQSNNDAVVDSARPITCAFDMVDVSLSHAEAFYPDCVIVISDSPKRCGCSSGSSSSVHFTVPPHNFITTSDPFGERQDSAQEQQPIQDAAHQLLPSYPSFTTDIELEWARLHDEAIDWQAEQWEEVDSRFSCGSGISPDGLMMNDTMTNQPKTRTTSPGF